MSGFLIFTEEKRVVLSNNNSIVLLFWFAGLKTWRLDCTWLVTRVQYNYIYSQRLERMPVCSNQIKSAIIVIVAGVFL